MKVFKIEGPVNGFFAIREAENENPEFFEGSPLWAFVYDETGLAIATSELVAEGHQVIVQ